MWGFGLPEHGTFLRLLYNEVSETLIVAFQQEFENKRFTEGLYYRHRLSDTYVPVPGADTEIHYGDPLSCAKAPRIIFNVTRWNDNGGDWESVSSLNLLTHELRREITKADLQEPGFERVWISSLISAREDASAVFCDAAFEQRLPSGNAMVHYRLCELQLTQPKLIEIAPLPQVFA